MDCARNIITANFSGGGTSATTAPLWQWDYGQALCITGIDLPAAFEVHFSTNRTGGVSTVAVGADGQVTIPNELLTIGKNLNAWIYLSDAQGEGETEYSILIPVKARPMPETYDAEVSGEFDDVVRQVSEYAQTAQTAADNAGASASAAAASADSAAASASAAEIAKTASETAQGKAEDAQAAAETAAQTATEKAQQTAQDAAQAVLDAGRAESAAQRAEAAETGAESAKTDAETAAQGAAASASAASASSTSAGQAATSAGQSATAAAQSAASIEGDVQTASQKAAEAEAAANQAVTAKEAAQTAQQGAETAATNAGQSASTATAKASEAATSASNAAQSKTDAEAAAARAEQAAATLTVDSALSDTSVNPVQNKVITEEVTQLKTAIDALKITDTASGAIASFSDGADDIPVRGLTVEMSPIQDLHGYDSPWPAGGGKNLFDKNTVSTGSYDPTNGAFNSYGIRSDYIKVTPGQSISENKVKATTNGQGEQTFFSSWIYFDSNKQFVSGTWNSSNTVTVPNNAEYLVVSTSRVIGDGDNHFAQSVVDTFLADYIIANGETIPTYSPYSNICPISGRESVMVTRAGANLFDKNNALDGYIDDTDGDLKGMAPYKSTDYIRVNDGSSYYVKSKQTSSMWGAWYDENKNFVRGVTSYANSVITAPSNASYVRLTIKSSASGSVDTFAVNYPSTDTAYHAYTGETISVSWESEAGTVYGGTVDVTTGVMTVDRAMATFDESSDEKWTLQSINSHGIANFYTQVQHYPRVNYKTACNMLAPQGSPISDTSTEGYYAHQNGGTIYIRISADRASTVDEWKAWLAQNPLQLVYGLAEPITIQLTPAQLSTLHGQNNVWSDADSVTVEYVADPKLYIARLTEPDADMVADANIISGSYFMVSNTLYLATANIASGANIVPGVNCTKTNLSAALNAINV